MGCRIGRLQYEQIQENINQTNKRMEQLEKIFEVLTNDSRLKDIIEEINKNQNNINNKNVSLQQQESEPEDSGCIRESTIGENEI